MKINVCATKCLKNKMFLNFVSIDLDMMKESVSTVSNYFFSKKQRLFTNGITHPCTIKSFVDLHANGIK